MGEGKEILKFDGGGGKKTMYRMYLFRYKNRPVGR
jgi:hypothetical protein